MSTWKSVDNAETLAKCGRSQRNAFSSGNAECFLPTTVPDDQKATNAVALKNSAFGSTLVHGSPVGDGEELIHFQPVSSEKEACKLASTGNRKQRRI